MNRTLSYLATVGFLVVLAYCAARGADNDVVITQRTATGQEPIILADPGADRILFWDESANEPKYLTAGSGLSITGTTITASGSGGTWGSITGTLSTQTDLQSALDAKLGTSAAAAAYQPLDSDLTSIAGLTTTTFGRGLLELSAYPTFNQSTTGNAATATALQTARTINGTSFDGTANITVTAAAGTLTGSTLASGVTASSLTSLGTLTSMAMDGAGTITRSGLGTTTTAGLTLQTTTAAAAGAQQVSPSLDLIGQGWKTTATAASQSAGVRLHVLPVQGSTAPTAELRISSVINGSETNVFNIDSSGNITKFCGAFTLQNVGGSLTFAGGTIKVGDSFFTGGFIYPGNSTSSGAFTYGGSAGVVDMRGYFAPTQPQLIRPHNTYTSSTNYERGKVGWESNTYVVGTEKGSGGGSARAMALQVDGTTRIQINTDGTITFPSLQTTAGATGTLYNDGGTLKISP